MASASASPAAAGTRRLLDNLSVLVLENTYERGTRSGMHSHAHGRFVYVVEGGTLRVHLPAPRPEDNRTMTFGDLPHPVDVELPTGFAGWRPPERHALENVGGGLVRIIEVEIKRSGEEPRNGSEAADGDDPPPGVERRGTDDDGSREESDDDAIDLGLPEGFESTDGRELLFRNRWGAIVLHRVEREGQIEPYPAGGDRLLYMLTRGRFRYKGPDGFTRQIFRFPGDLKYYRAGRPPRGISRDNALFEAVEFALAHEMPSRRMRIRGARVVPDKD